jgi:dienelactone hydrolase/ketosteroid isomerase-like protein
MFARQIPTLGALPRMLGFSVVEVRMSYPFCSRVFLAIFLLSALPAVTAGPQNVTIPGAAAQTAGELTLSSAATELVFREGLVAGLLGSYGRSAVPSDFLAWQIATGAYREPREGEVVGPDDRSRTQTWTRAEAGADGWIQNRALNGGYLYIAVRSERARTMILDASGYYVVRVNGRPRGGEKYGMDWVRHPVQLREGRNEFLFQGERGRVRARLLEPAAPVFFTDSDPTLPDLVIGSTGPYWAGIRLVNATEETIRSIVISYSLGGQTGTASLATVIPPLMTRKLAVPLALQAPSAEGPLRLALRARIQAGGREIETPAFEIELKALAPAAHHVRTFVSEIDGSVQYYAVVPLTGATSGTSGARPALVLSLHGAGVEAIGQARAYQPKDWAYVVAPTNRRPYGFDWEDWGRLDALEVLAEASRLFDTDPARTYLTGHSMGGHGTWHVGVTFPDRWAAIAPSAGWHSFSSYGGGPVYKEPTPVEKMLVRANRPGETVELARNLLHYGVYVLHGEKDTNVPVAQARFMRTLLAQFHTDFAYYEQPGAEHWWGNQCVDWPPLFEFLKQHTRPADRETGRVEFITANPGISARSRWVTILAQEQQLEYSRVAIERDAKTGAFKGTTANIARMALDTGRVSPSGGTIALDLDGTRLEAKPEGDGRLVLERTSAGWQKAPPTDPGFKSPQRSGGFKDVFRHRVALVYGTLGNAEENARAFDKARFDAEMFWYRGNGSVDVVPDKSFDPAKEPDRSVVLYGNADTNALWTRLLGNSLVEIRNGRARIGEREFVGADLGAYFIRPRPDSPTASVGAVAWTGPAGWTAAGPGQYFVSGAGFPDLILFSAEMLRAGTDGIRMIGWFGNDWSLARGDFVWNPAPAKQPAAENPARSSLRQFPS